MKTLLFFMGMAACILGAANPTRQQTRIESANGLGMSIAPDDAASGPDRAMRFSVTFTNLRNEDLTFVPMPLSLRVC